MSSVQTYDIYPQCQKFLLDFGFTQDGDVFTISLHNKPKKLFFPKDVTEESVIRLADWFAGFHLHDDVEDKNKIPKQQVQNILDFLFSIRNLVDCEKKNDNIFNKINCILNEFDPYQTILRNELNDWIKTNFPEEYDAETQNQDEN